MTTYRVTINGRPDITVDCDDITIGSDGSSSFYAADDTLVAYVPAASLSHIERIAKKCEHIGPFCAGKCN